jgi:hypothetical protein
VASFPNKAEEFKQRLVRSTGLTESAIAAAWPDWWSEAADASASSQADLKFTLARKLGLDPRSLLDDETPRFVWEDSAKFKNFRGDMQDARPAISSFGTALGRMLIKGCPSYASLQNLDPLELRQSILASRPFVDITGLIGFMWGVGIPVIHLRVHPLAAKHMCAMSIRIGERYAVLLARDANYPASTAFHLAHEIAHIVLGHLANGGAVVDMDDPAERVEETDPEEIAADRYALTLLTGYPRLDVENTGAGRSARQLAAEVIRAAQPNAIEPGTLALCYGYNTKDWATVQKSMQFIYNKSVPVWEGVNKIAASQLQWELMSDESSSYIRAVMGGI